MNAGSGALTTSGVALPRGWTLEISDRFGTGPDRTVRSFAELHTKYYEAQYYSRESNGLVRIPNVVINHEQETYTHFEIAIAFSADHLTIQGRGHPDGSITSAELVSIRTFRSFCLEARYRIPSADKSWPAFWAYGATENHDASEIDFEQPVTPHQGVADVSMFNHPPATGEDRFPDNVEVLDRRFRTRDMMWRDPSFDGSTSPHFYTMCYDDAAAMMSRYIDGKPMYRARWKWNASLGGSGHGADATAIVNLAVGGSWPGNLTDPSAYHGDLDLYSIEYYGPR